MAPGQRSSMAVFSTLVLAGLLVLGVSGLAQAEVDPQDAVDCQKEIGRGGRKLVDEIADVEKALDKLVKAYLKEDEEDFFKAGEQFVKRLEDVSDASTQLVDRILGKCSAEELALLGFGSFPGFWADKDTYLLVPPEVTPENVASLICLSKALLGALQVIIEYPLTFAILDILEIDTGGDTYSLMETILDPRCYAILSSPY